VLHQFVEFLESSFIEQELSAFPRRQLSFAMLAFAPFGAASFIRGGVAPSKFLDAIHEVIILEL
jgi:hypothetical protein